MFDGAKIENKHEAHRTYPVALCPDGAGEKF
nr:MAG TPA: hypothetical protein [Caudoviricetes sp.]